ncbi:YhfC family intramembrane metalloprotease [Clostridium sp. WILCCON 0269]|uniref:YhfC family intramembrane metalloprotease n=1 Tax=Candidatus Clostridium eludens TaxID=3381663 RepID=A0ABW8SQ23_9CLOT
MVSSTSIMFLVVSLIISVGAPVGLLAYFYKKYKISIKSVLVGVLIFVIFSQILEKLLHYFVLTKNLQTAVLLKNPWLFMIYGGLAAGIFEEVGRYVGFKFLLKGQRDWKDGIAYGIGHGGIEAILIGGVGSIQNIVYSNLINSGTFEKVLSVKVPASMLATIKNSLVNTPFYMFGFIGIERILVLPLQIALSLVVLYGIKKDKKIYLLYAIIIHAIIDFPAALYQAGKVKSIFLVEGGVLVIAIISLIFIIKSKGLFNRISSEKAC